MGVVILRLRQPCVVSFAIRASAEIDRHRIDPSAPISLRQTRHDRQTGPGEISLDELVVFVYDFARGCRDYGHAMKGAYDAQRGGQ
jgi:hypothetical protein